MEESPQTLWDKCQQMHKSQPQKLKHTHTLYTIWCMCIPSANCIPSHDISCMYVDLCNIIILWANCKQRRYHWAPVHYIQPWGVLVLASSHSTWCKRSNLRCWSEQGFWWIKQVLVWSIQWSTVGMGANNRTVSNPGGWQYETISFYSYPWNSVEDEVIWSLCMPIWKFVLKLPTLIETPKFVWGGYPRWLAIQQ